MSDGVIIAVEGRVGRIRLDRPAALHALTTAMCLAVLDAVEHWRDDGLVDAVMIDHAAGRGFCAGGDIRMIGDSGAADGVDARNFFHTEYRMNHRLFTFAKPSVVIMDGVTMGGGVGISQPCRFRVATEQTRFAMPETAIGLFPDVGGGWYLSRLPGRMGQYLALTGARLDGVECLRLGLATHYIASDRLPAVKQSIIDRPVADLAMILDEAAENAGAVRSRSGSILDQRDPIDRLFGSDRIETIFAALAADDSTLAQTALATLRTRSPQAMKVSLKLLLDGAAMATFEDEMRQEFAVATRVVQRHDLAEGVRAVIVDKDHAPRWDPPTVDDVSDHLIDQIFAPLPDDQAWTPA